MVTEASQIPQAKEYVYTPPTLPAHLAAAYDLKPIVGHPINQDVRAVHAAIRAINVESQVPRLCNPDLSLQLSQHLFNVQMAVYRSQYSLALSADNTYTPPSLPSHISAELEPIVRAPSNEQLKAVQHAVRVAESLVTSPLFNHDLSMQLSQHLFNLQFARYIQDSTLGRFASKPEESRNVPQESKSHSSSTPSNTGRFASKPEESRNVPQESKSHSSSTPSNTGAPAPSEPVRAGVPEVGVSQPLVAEPSKVECRCAIATEITRQGKVMNDVKETLNESKGILENMNRVLIATQRNQVTVGEWNNHNYAHINPVNEQGVTAAVSGV
ncbi:hypothetical protein RSAG8_08926, partial [Rhizoctonia solani AG-8 WAC10335]